MADPREIAAVLVGGLGTRLRAAVPDVPKPLAPVQGEPFLAKLLRWLAREDMPRAMLLCGHGSEAIRDFARDWNSESSPPALECLVEPAPMGTGGAVRHAIRSLPAEFVLANGDSLCPAGLGALKSAHHSAAADVTLFAVYQPDGAARGALELGEEDRVVRFAEKQRPGPGWINAGVYRMKRELFDDVPADRPVSLENDLLPAWIAQGRRVCALRVVAPFLDIGVPADWERAQQEGWLS